MNIISNQKIKDNIKKAIQLSPNVKVIKLASHSFTSINEFGMYVIELLNSNTVYNITLGAITEQGYYGKTVANLENAISRSLFNDKVTELTFQTTTIKEFKSCLFSNNITQTFQSFSN